MTFAKRFVVVVAMAVSVTGCGEKPPKTTTTGTSLRNGINKTGNKTDSEPPPRDPWEDIIETRIKEYKQNREKLRSDWQLVLDEAKKGDLNADKLAADIVELSRKLVEERARLDEWTNDLKRSKGRQQ